MIIACLTSTGGGTCVGSTAHCSYGRVQRLLARTLPVRVGKSVHALSYQAIESRRARSRLSSGRHSSTRDHLVSEALALVEEVIFHSGKL